MLKGEAMCDFEAPKKEDIGTQTFQKLFQSLFQPQFCLSLNRHKKIAHSIWNRVISCELILKIVNLHSWYVTTHVWPSYL